MINLIDVFAILVVHYIADFVLQTKEQAENKSSSNIALTNHVTDYTVTFMLAMLISQLLFGYSVFGPNLASFEHLKLIIGFGVITFVFHWVTDYITSRVALFYYIIKEDRNFFKTVGFDQLLHYIQLFLTFYLLKQ